MGMGVWTLCPHPIWIRACSLVNAFDFYSLEIMAARLVALDWFSTPRRCVGFLNYGPYYHTSNIKHSHVKSMSSYSMAYQFFCLLWNILFRRPLEASLGITNEPSPNKHFWIICAWRCIQSFTKTSTDVVRFKSCQMR